MRDDQVAVCEQCGIKYYKLYNGKEYCCPNNHVTGGTRIGLSANAIPAQEVMFRWNMIDVNFVEYVIEHLPQMYFDWDENGIALPWRKSLTPWRKDKWEPMTLLPNTMKGRAELLKLLNAGELFFYPDNIEEFEEENAEVLQEPETKTIAEETDNQYYIINKGEYLEIRFENEKKTLRNLKGMQYIIPLLKKPWTPINVTVLRSTVTKSIDGAAIYGSDTEAQLRIHGTSLSDFSEEQFNQDGMTLSDTAPNKVTEHELKIIKQSAEHLSEKLQRAKASKRIEEIEEITEHIEDFRKGILNEYSLRSSVKDDEIIIANYQMKRLGPDREKDRQNVKNNIEKTLERIKAQGLQKLYEHLKKYINGGEMYSYSPIPEEQPSWRIEGI